MIALIRDVNSRMNRDNFAKVPGKYDWVKIDYASEDTEEIEKALASTAKAPKKIIVCALSDDYTHSRHVVRRNPSWSRRSSR